MPKETCLMALAPSISPEKGFFFRSLGIDHYFWEAVDLRSSFFLPPTHEIIIRQEDGLVKVFRKEP